MSALRILSSEFVAENNTFKRGLMELRDFEADTLLAAEEAIRQRGDSNTELAGFLDVAREQGWDLTHSVSALAEPGSPVSRQAFDAIAGRICAPLRAGPNDFDGILLRLHGAQVTEFCDHGEEELLRRLRSIVGPELPIAATLDLHANVSDGMGALAQIWVSYKTYPHVDVRETGRHAARLLGDAAAGRIAPRTLIARIPMMEEANSGRSDVAETAARYAAARAQETGPILAVSLNAGYPDPDLPDIGPTVLVTYDDGVPGAKAQAERLCADHAQAIWDARERCATVFLSPMAAAARAAAHPAGAGPFLVADYADNPGSGAHGDATALLAALLEARVEVAVFAPLIDPSAAADLHRHRVGDEVTLDIGGRAAPDYGGGPLRVTGRVVLLSNGDWRGDGPMMGGLDRSFGPTAVLRVAGVDVLIVTEREQMLDLQQLRTFGIEPAVARVLALKSMQHFRAAFAPIAAEIVVCDSGSLSTPDPSRRTYVRVSRPIWPLDKEIVFKAATSIVALDTSKT